jgi:hypothetical protein
MRLLAKALIAALVLGIILVLDVAPEPTTRVEVYGPVTLICERSTGPGFIRDECRISRKANAAAR